MVFSLMKNNEHTLEFLTELDDLFIANLLKIENTERIANLIQNEWNRNFVNEIKSVVGDEWLAGNLSYHLKSRPIWNDTDNYLDVVFIGKQFKPCNNEVIEAFDGKGKKHCFNINPQVVMIGMIE